MNREIFERIYFILLSEFRNREKRQPLVEQALNNCDVLKMINWTGTSNIFVYRLTSLLLLYGECEPGKDAMVMLLEKIRLDKSLEYQKEIDVLIKAVYPRTIKIQDLHDVLSQPPHPHNNSSEEHQDDVS